jgi:hypothetical protein
MKVQPIDGEIISVEDVRGISEKIWDEIVEGYTSSAIPVKIGYGMLIIYLSNGIEVIYNIDKVYIEFKDNMLKMWCI